MPDCPPGLAGVAGADTGTRGLCWLRQDAFIVLSCRLTGICPASP
ncbi:hypothetical protein LHGZ1_0286 [Laribacter hongkongensis]|uniref:Uncharacterized protein n=1 Tax=Laribacter hongkongensis TaxID=168471 RepID=A0A248LEH2_9NEIS|nr:hypothetical protein LHGZ1_0286 [Laribacter hongkongensis]